jgi:hypothetical protein
VFEELYGNLWDLVQRSKAPAHARRPEPAWNLTDLLVPTYRNLPE